MAELNYLTLTKVFGKLAVANVTTNLQNVVSNPTNSGNLLRINTVWLTNVANTPSHANVIILNTLNNTREFIVHREAIRNFSTFKVIARDSSVYLPEGHTLQIQSNANSRVEAIITYESLQ